DADLDGDLDADLDRELEALNAEVIDDTTVAQNLYFGPPDSPWGTDPLRTTHLRDLIFQSLNSDAAVRTLESDVSISAITVYDPRIVEQQERVEQGAFDPNLSTKFTRARIDQPPSSFFGPGLVTQNERNETEFSARLEKLWGTGTKTAIAYEPSLAYLFFPQGVSSGFNPLHSSDLLFELKQPLLKGNGRRATQAPIRIARVRTQQSHLELEAAFQSQLRSIEEAYWKLHSAHVQLKALDQIIPLSQTVVAIEEHRFAAERVTQAEVARAAVALEEFRRQRASAILNVKRRNFQLAQLLGYSWDGSAPLFPVDQPAFLPPTKDVASLASIAMSRRPDLLIRRLEVSVKMDQLSLAENQYLPELDLRTYYRASGLSDSLGQSVNQLSEFRYEDWGYGVSFSMPLGRNAARGQLHSAKFAVVREQVKLASYEKQVAFEIAGLVASAQADYDQFRSAMRQLSHSQKWLDIARTRYEQPRLNRGRESLLLLLADYQSAMQAYVDAITQVAETLADYNSDLAKLEEAQGTTFNRWGIQWYGGEVAAPASQVTTRTRFAHSEVPSE
ncbi:MAG: outer membrane protein TolC, partial [Pirellulaceae bacterium]